MKTLMLSVYRSNHIGDCTNGGISSKHDKLYVLCNDGPFDFDDEKQPAPENVVMLVKRVIMGKDVYHLEPLKPASGAGWMAGGNYAATSDSRFSRMIGFYGAVAIHDRQETWEQYDRMSR